MNAKHLPTWAKKACKAMHMTPTEFETRNNDKSVDALPDSAVILIVKNSKKTVELTAGDMRYIEKYS